MDSIQIILELVQKNAAHISTLNIEMGGVLATQKIIMWFIGINVALWVGILVNIIAKKIFKNNH